MKTKPKRLLAVLLTLCLALSIVPITAFAESGAYAVIFYPGDYGTMTKNDQIPFVYYGIDYDVNKPYYYKLNVSSTDTLGFAGSIIDTLLPNQGYEFAYWTADAAVYQVGNDTAIPAGTALSSDQIQNGVTVKSDVTFTAHFKQIITEAAIENVRFNYMAGDAPQSSANVSDPLDELFKYEIAYECWEEMENGNPVAFWYSDESKYPTSAKRITRFEDGKTYMYSIELREKDGYTFADNCSVMINGNPIPTSANVIKTVDGLFAMNVKTIRPQAPEKISVIEINNATLTFKDGDKPVFTGTVPENDQYALRCEWWSLDENTGIVSTEPEWGGDIYKNKITAFEAGKTYHYGVYVTAYTADISPDAKLKINGREVEYTRIGDENDTQSFWVETDLTMTPAADGHTHSYGTDWKYDSANHWHECSCGKKSELAAHSYKTTIIKATQKKDGSVITKCTVCGAAKSKTVIAKASSVKLSKTTLTYKGKTQKPSVTVKDSKGKTLKNGTDYTVKYSKGCKNVGQYTVTITFKGKYSGTKSLTFKIVPKGTSISKLTAGKKQFTAKWSKQTAQTTGYELQYSTKSSMGGAKTVKVGKNKTTSSIVKKLKGGKKYYVRVRTYKTVKINGKSVKLYSSWSKVKNVKTK